jgi:serine/threonine-protein kinase
MQAGDRILSYIVERELGEGGMGTVYLGRHTVLDQQVAIKALSPLLARDQALRERFIQEANIQAGLRHPGIVQVLTAEMEGEQPSLVMEYIEGRSLSEVLEIRGALPVDDALKIMAQVLSAVGYAHRQGVIHRDLKPSNVMVMASGEAKVTDFGIAKVLGSSKLTRTGTAMGSPHFMSPEQIRRPETVDARSDVYSLGCVFYEVLTGRPPFGEKDASGTESDFEIKTAHVSEAVPALETVKPDVPAWLAQLVMTMLEKAPDKRQASCEVILEQLKAAGTLDVNQSAEIVAAMYQDQNDDANDKQESERTPEIVPESAPENDTPPKKSGSSSAFTAVFIIAIIFGVVVFFIQRGTEQTTGAIAEQAEALASQINAGNPNNLPVCSRNKPSGSGNCWGTYFFPFGHGFKGNRYVGELKSGIPDGKGSLFFSNTYQVKGDRYVGEFKQGSLDGQGAYYFGASNQFRGEKYVGEFKDNQFNGRGIRYRANGSIKESGVFEANRLIKPE